MTRSARYLIPACVSVLLAGCDSDVLAPKHISSQTAAAARVVGATFSTWAVSASQISMSWPDNARNESGWEVHRSTTGASGSFSLLASLPTNSTDYSNTGLAPLTQYCYKVRSFKKSGPNTSFAAFTNVACSSTFGPPNAPSAAYAYPATSSVVAIGWTDNGDSEQEFRIERSADPAGPWTVAGTVGSNRTFFTDNGRAAEQLVCYRVIATNAYGESAPSNVACTAPPQSPSNVIAASADGSSIDVVWTDASNVEDGHSVERGLDGVSFSVIADLPANATSYHDGSVTPDTRYWYRVRAKKGQGFSDYGQPWPYAAAASSPPEAPTLYRVFPAGSAGAFVDWSSSSVTTAGFRIERSTDGQATWTTAATVAASGMFLDEGRVPEAQVCYRVVAFNAAGESPASAVDCTVPPAHPTNLSLAQDADGFFTASWTDNSNVEEGYYVSFYLCYDDSGCWYYEYFLDANTTSVGLGYGSSAYIDVYAYSDGGYSDAGTWAGAVGQMSISSSPPVTSKRVPAPKPPAAMGAKRPRGNQ